MHLLCLFAAVFIPPVLSLGINCRGSPQCHPDSSCSTSLILLNYIEGLEDGIYIPGNVHIACMEHICAFLQHTRGAVSQDVKRAAEAIVKHGCDRYVRTSSCERDEKALHIIAGAR